MHHSPIRTSGKIPRAAPLNAVSRRDVVIRVFVLFKATTKPARVSDSLERRTDVFGYGSTVVLVDDKLFRVLKWGGIEVKR